MQPISQKICKYNVFSPKICKYVVFSPEIRKYGIFVAKICKNALIDSFEGFAVVIDNSASYAGLVPRNLDSRRHRGPRLAAQGTSSRGPLWLYHTPLLSKI